MPDAFTASSGTRIVYDSAGNGPVVLAIHGVGGGAYFFRGVAERLGGHWRVVAIDLPGTGRSTAAPDAFSLGGWVRDLGELVTKLSRRPIVIVGHSLGTIVALSAWDAWPSLVGKLVFVGGLPEVRAAIRERLVERVAAIGDGPLDGWGAVVAPRNFSPASLQHRGEVVGLFERAFEAQPAAPYLRSIAILLAASATGVVPRVTVPCLSISGADDPYAPPDHVEHFLDQLPNPTTAVVLPEVGHLPFFEAPEAFAAALRAFLESR